MDDCERGVSKVVVLCITGIVWMVGQLIASSVTEEEGFVEWA
jgi:hypothetical protein